MPQKTQIVPKFQHPHVETYINDYTQYKDEDVTVVDNNSKFISVFKSYSGIDNVLVKKSSLTDFIKTYGTSNYEKYGQPLMMPIGILSAGNATVHCMRVMPDNAFAANSILNLLYKIDGTKMIIKFQASHIDIGDATSEEGEINHDLFKTQKAFKKYLRSCADAMTKTGETEVDELGFNSIPIATFRMNGRGVYGNEYRWRIVPNSVYEKDYGIKMYTFEVMNTSGGIEKVASYVGSIVTSDKYGDSLTLINDIIDEEDMGDIIMDVQVIEENVEFVYDIFKSFVEKLPEKDQDKNGIPDLDEFDPFFGRLVGSNDKNINIQIVGEMVNGVGVDDYSHENDISIDRSQGTSLAGGDDGDFGVNATWHYVGVDTEGKEYEEDWTGQRAIDAATTDAYVKAFSGVFDKTIVSTRRTPCTALLDANYPYEVKEKMAELADMRESTLLYIDGGIEVTTSNIKSTVARLENFNTRNISKSIQHYTTKDPTTKKRCEVTATYFIGQSLATHFRNEGSWIPFVKSYARLSGHVKNTLEPCIDDTDSELKEFLYENRINYFECIEENVYERATQNTAQGVNSDLVEENNMYTLYEIKRIIEADCWDSLYSFTSAEARADFSTFEKAKFSGWEGNRLQTIDIVFDANDWEAERSIVHCYVSVQFRNLMKRVIIEIDVNKRNFTE